MPLPDGIWKKDTTIISNPNGQGEVPQREARTMVAVYPNPATSQMLTLDLSSLPEPPQTIFLTIYDAKGAVIIKQTYSEVFASRVAIDIHSLATGAYYLTADISSDHLSRHISTSFVVTN